MQVWNGHSWNDSEKPSCYAWGLFSLKGLSMRDIESIKTLLETSIYNKPHLSCEEQLVLLEHRGVKIENKNLLWNN